VGREPAAGVLEGLDPAEARRILDAGRPRAVRKGATIFREGEPARAMHLVEAGRIRLGQVTAAGDEVVVRMAGPGELFAAVAALDGRSYPFTATAAEPTRLREWDLSVLAELLRACPRFQANVLGIVGIHAREMLDRFRELATEPAPQRIARALLRLLGPPGPSGERVAEGVTRRDLAAMAGTTLYTASRVMAAWQREDLVRPGRGRVVVPSAARLVELAEARA
jgi:CRP-like cAMP-binding protein